MPQLIIQPLGDTALLVRPADAAAGAPGAAAHWAAECRGNLLPGVTDIIPAFQTLGVYFDPPKVPVDPGGSASAVVSAWIQHCIEQAGDPGPTTGRCHELPVCYAGDYAPDLPEVAAACGLSPRAVVAKHLAADYLVGAVGFTPGFPYLEGLPDELHTPRRATPRTITPAGAVAIGGRFTGAYPHDSPGGWNVIGRTPAALFSAQRDSPALVQAGDRVRFVEVSPAELEQLQQAAPPAAAQSKSSNAPPLFEVLSPGAQTTLQDLGRPGRRSLGVSASGAMDPESLRLANLLSGNRPDAVTLEMTLTGPLLLCQRDVQAAVAGAVPSAFGRPRRFSITAGEKLDLRELTGGARAYLAVASGFAGQRVLGGAGTDLLAGFGGLDGRALRRGDRLGQHESHTDSLAPLPDASNWSLAPVLRTNSTTGAPAQLRVLRGPQANRFAPEAWRQLLHETYQVSRLSNRMGLRLEGPELVAHDCEGLDSQPVVQGAIQVPPNGQPIVLGADSQTLGGYPLIACVASADLPLLGQLRPGQRVAFVEISLPTAERLRIEAESQYNQIAAGIALKLN